MKTATDRQLEVLNFVRSFRAQTGLAPSYAEIARELGFSRASAGMHVAALLRKGLVVRVEMGRTPSGRARRVLSVP